MRQTVRQRKARKIINYIVATALLLGQVAGFLALPSTALAAVSKDPNAEIVYIDDNDVIRVLDTQGSPLVQWFSPDAGWDQAVLLDVTGDGDMEILGLDNQGSSNLRIAVFDPVLAKGATDPNKQINGIPWDTLFTAQVPADGKYVVGGDFDPNIPSDPNIHADEFALGYLVGDTSYIQIWNANSLGSDGRPTGRDWKVHIQKEYPNYQYDFGTAGNLNGKGAEELIVFDSELDELNENDATRMDMYVPDQDMLLTDSETASSDRFKFGVAGQLIADGQDELAAILSGGDNSRTLRTYIMNDRGEVEEDATWVFTPQPDWPFLADIRGNGDEELFFLRGYSEGLEGARLIMRDDWGEDQRQNTDLIEWNLMEDGSNNEFRAGAGGDIDGDGRDEVVLMRDDRIRIYTNPEIGNEESAAFTDYMTPTDNRRINLLVGDLDAGGSTTGPILQFSHNLVEAIVAAGTVSQDYVVNVANIGTPGGVRLGISVPPGNSWAQVNTTLATTPFSVTVKFDATNLVPGSYSTTMTFRTNPPRTDVVNDNFVVALNLTVVPPKLTANPPMLTMYRLPGENDVPEEPFTKTIEIDSSTDLAFSAALLGVPDADVANIASSIGLAGPITGGGVDAEGNFIVTDDYGNSRALTTQPVSTAAVQTATLLVDPGLTWITPTLDSNVAPAELTLVIDPSILADGERHYAVLFLVADIRSGPPTNDVVIVPIEIAEVGSLLRIGFLRK